MSSSSIASGMNLLLDILKNLSFHAVILSVRYTPLHAPSQSLKVANPLWRYKFALCYVKIPLYIAQVWTMAQWQGPLSWWGTGNLVDLLLSFSDSEFISLLIWLTWHQNWLISYFGKPKLNISHLVNFTQFCVSQKSCERDYKILRWQLRRLAGFTHALSFAEDLVYCLYGHVAIWLGKAYQLVTEMTDTDTICEE